GLHGVVDAEALAGDGGRGNALGEILEQRVQLSGRDLFFQRAVELHGGVEHAVDLVAAHGGNEEDGRAGREEKTAANGGLVFGAVFALGLVVVQRGLGRAVGIEL